MRHDFSQGISLFEPLWKRNLNCKADHELEEVLEKASHKKGKTHEQRLRLHELICEINS